MTEPEHPSALLRRAAAAIKADADRCGDPAEGFLPAVAKWLESVAGDTEEALAVARAWLNETEAEGAGHG